MKSINYHVSKRTNKQTHSTYARERARECLGNVPRLAQIQHNRHRCAAPNQFANQSINQSINHSITQSLNHSITQSLTHSLTHSLSVRKRESASVLPQHAKAHSNLIQ